jgi:hypothetical protein
MMEALLDCMVCLMVLHSGRLETQGWFSVATWDHGQEQGDNSILKSRFYMEQDHT